MDSREFDKISESLKQQQDNLLGWLKSAPEETKSIRLGSTPAEKLEKHASVLASAIEQAKKEELGLCKVCHDHVEAHWLETNYTTCVCIEHLSGEERARLENELELSQKVQRALLPHEPPSIPGWEVAAFSQPASIVGGDYFDFLRFRDGAHAIVIADVMGKGMPASMLMASLQATLRIILPETDSPREVLQRLNRLFSHNINLTKFVTIVIVRLEADGASVLYANAGHNPPYLVRSGVTASLVSLRPTGAAIGLVEDPEFGQERMTVAAGDQLVLYTDGVIEAANGKREQFGEGRLERYIRRESAVNPTDFQRGLRKAMHEFSGGLPLTDDTTIVICRRTS